MGAIVEHNLKPQRRIIQCNMCIHHHKGSKNCDAFPNGILFEILKGDHDHTIPYLGDNGILFEPITNISPILKTKKVSVSHN